MDISWANEDSLLTSTMSSSIIPSQDTMQMIPSFLSPQDVKTNTALYIQFECSCEVNEETECITYENIESTCNCASNQTKFSRCFDEAKVIISR